MKRRRVADPFRIVAIPAAVALAAIGAIAAERAHWPAIVGAAAGALAAILTVLALPSVSTRRATVLLLGVGGLGALRHAAVPGTNSGYLLVLWAGGTLCTMLLVDRAETETTAPLAGGARLASRGGEATRNAIVVGLLIVIAAVAFVPTITDRLGRHVWPGIAPNIGDVFDAPASLRQSNTLDMTSRPRLSNKVVFTVDAPRADFWRGETFDVWNGHEWGRSDGDADGYFLGRQGAQVAVPAAPFDVGATEGQRLPPDLPRRGGILRRRVRRAEPAHGADRQAAALARRRHRHGHRRCRRRVRQGRGVHRRRAAGCARPPSDAALGRFRADSRRDPRRPTRRSPVRRPIGCGRSLGASPRTRRRTTTR